MKNKRLLCDLLLILAIAALAGAIFLLTRLSSGDGEAVEIRIGGELFKVLPLDTDSSTDVGGLCTVVIENGAARVSESTCSNLLCVNHRPISRSGESIVCLPNGVTVRVSGGADFYI